MRDEYEGFNGATRQQVLDRVAQSKAEGQHDDPMEDRQNDAPTLGDLLALTDDYPQMRYIGYQIHPPRRDVRVSVEGFECSGLTAAQCMTLLARFKGADELDHEAEADGTYGLRAWWD